MDRAGTAQIKAELGGYIYFVTNGKAIKIGFSGAPKERLQQLQTSSDQKLTLMGFAKGTPDDEREIHYRFSHLRKSGEWFRSRKDLLAFAAAVCARGSIAPAKERTPIEQEILKVRREVIAWAETKSGTAKMYCNSLISCLGNLVENPHYPDLVGSTLMTIDALRLTLKSSQSSVFST